MISKRPSMLGNQNAALKDGEWPRQDIHLSLSEPALSLWRVYFQQRGKQVDTPGQLKALLKERAYELLADELGLLAQESTPISEQTQNS